MCEGVRAERSKMKKYIYIYLYSFVGRRLSLRRWLRKEEETSKNDIEIIRNRKMGEENWNMTIHLTFPNIPIQFNKLIGPACSIDSIDLLIFKETLWEVIELIAFCWDLLFSRTYKIEIRGYLISGKWVFCSNILMDVNKGEKMTGWIKKDKKYRLTFMAEWNGRIGSPLCRLTLMNSGSNY